MFSSLRLRLTLWYAGVLALLLVGFAAVFYFMVDRAVRQIADDSIEDACNSLITTLNTEKRLNEELILSDETIRETLDDFRFQNIVFAVYNDKLQIIALSPRLRPLEGNHLLPFNIAEEEIPLERVRSAVSGGEGLESIRTVSDPEIRIFVKRAAFERGSLLVAAIRPLTPQIALLSNLRVLLIAGIPFALLLSSVGGYFLARKSLQPVREMTERAALITSRNLSQRLASGSVKDELGVLADTFNEMLSRLEASFDQQKRFMADASHELRSPLAIIRGESEVSLQKKERREIEYRESLEIIRQEGVRLSHIVEDLFILARADGGRFRPGFTTFYLDEVVADSARAVRTLTEQKGLSLELRTDEGLVFEGNEQMIRRLFINLLDNALKYSNEGALIRVECEDAGDHFRISVENTGNPIPQAEQPHIFDRFYRADKTRSHKHGYELGAGAGLGLAIGRSIARIHGGDLVLVRSDETSTVFTATLPKKQNK